MENRGQYSSWDCLNSKRLKIMHVYITYIFRERLGKQLGCREAEWKHSSCEGLKPWLAVYPAISFNSRPRDSGPLNRANKHQASQVVQTVKCLPAMRETWVQTLGREDPLGKEMATHASSLTWKIPWTEEPGGLQSMGSQSQTRLSNFTHQMSSSLISWKTRRVELIVKQFASGQYCRNAYNDKRLRIALSQVLELQ